MVILGIQKQVADAIQVFFGVKCSYHGELVVGQINPLVFLVLLKMFTLFKFICIALSRQQYCTFKNKDIIKNEELLLVKYNDYNRIQQTRNCMEQLLHTEMKLLLASFIQIQVLYSL